MRHIGKITLLLLAVFAKLRARKPAPGLDDGDELFRTLANSIPQLAWMARADGHIFWFNQRWYDYTGTTPAQMKGWGWQSVHHPEELSRVLSVWNASIRKGEPAEIELPIRAKDGTYRWFLTRAIPLRNARGEIVRWVGTNTDIDDQRRASNAFETEASNLGRRVKESSTELSDSRSFLTSLIENLPNMVFVKDAKDLKFIRFNKAGEELLGYSRKDLIGKSDYDFFPKEQADFFTSKDRAVLAGHVIVDIPEEEVQTSRGKRILHTRKIPLFDQDGNPEFLLGISEDITDARFAEAERLRLTLEQAGLKERAEAAKRFAFLSEASAVLASSLDYHETLERLGKLVVPFLADWCTITMLSPGGAGLERVSAIHADPACAAALQELGENYPAQINAVSGIAEVIRSGKPIFTARVSEEELAQSARDSRHLELMRQLGCSSCMVVPILARGKIHGAIAFVSCSEARGYDSEHLVLAEELGRRAGMAIDNALLYVAAQKAIQERDDFLSIASHELKTPITSLKLQVQLTQRSTKLGEGIVPRPEKLARSLEISERQIDRLSGLVDELLDVTRIQAGKMKYIFEDVPLAELVEEAVERLSGAFRQVNSYIEVEAEPVTVRCDRYRMDQVVVNLLTNALKYGAGGKVVVRLEKAGSGARISVQDFGIGIEQEKVGKIFNRYERAVPHTSISGLGLGLYISREIVEAHGGNITVETKLGQGSVFTVHIPGQAENAKAAV